MKGHVYKRGKRFTYMFDGPPDALTGDRKQVSKGGFETEKEAWTACRAAMQAAEEGRFVKPSRRTLGHYLLKEWLPAIKSSTASTTWGNWKIYAESYVDRVVGKAVLQSFTAQQLQALYDHLLAKGRVKADFSFAMFQAWKAGNDEGKERTARQIATVSGATLNAARAAARRFRKGYVPAPKSPGLEPKTVRNVHTMMHAALAHAVRWRFVSENVAEQVNPPRVRRRKPTVWTTAQTKKFLKFIRGDRFYAVYLLASTTGIRRAELCGLRWPAIDLDAATLTVQPDTLVVVNGRAQESDGKTDNAIRLLSLDPVTVRALQEWQEVQRSERIFFDRDYQGTDRVFTWENGRDVHPDTIRQRFNRLAERCGLPRIRLYDLRHGYATAGLKSGINPKIISSRLGHASTGFTLDVYSHAVPGMDRQAAREIASMFVDDEEADEGPVSKSVSNGDENGPSDDL